MKVSLDLRKLVTYRRNMKRRDANDEGGGVPSSYINFVLYFISHCLLKLKPH
jgi:hypothetical protein